MLVVALSFKLRKSGDIMDQQCELPAGASILTVMKPSLGMWDFIQETAHVLGVPHEASPRVFNGEENAMLVAESAKLLSDVIES